MTNDVQVEPTLSATYAAAEAARTANHAGYHSPRNDPGNVYDRTGAAFELLRTTEQLVRMLGEDARRLLSTPGLYSTEGDPQVAVRSAAATITRAAGQINAAVELVNTAWSELSSVGVQLTDPT